MKQSIEARIKRLEADRNIVSQIDYSKFGEIMEKAKELPQNPHHEARDKWIHSQIGEPPKHGRARSLYWTQWAKLMTQWDHMDCENESLN